MICKACFVASVNLGSWRSDTRSAAMTTVSEDTSAMNWTLASLQGLRGRLVASRGAAVAVDRLEPFGFAILDGFPVSPGHSLVVPRRLISTWWEASEPERRDLWALVDEVKAMLDSSRAPDGYNVGFNAGSAAGQTVDHLHLHVIPRYDG